MELTNGVFASRQPLESHPPPSPRLWTLEKKEVAASRRAGSLANPTTCLCPPNSRIHGKIGAAVDGLIINLESPLL